MELKERIKKQLRIFGDSYDDEILELIEVAKEVIESSTGKYNENSKRDQQMVTLYALAFFGDSMNEVAFKRFNEMLLSNGIQKVGTYD